MSNKSAEQAAALLIAAGNHLDKQALGMATIVRDVPAGVDWGFFSNEDPRMHLQALPSMENAAKVWLEERGRRAFIPEGPWPASLRRSLASCMSSTRNRENVERRWIDLMIHKGWLRLSYESPFAVLRAYPGLAHEFTRTIDLRREATSPRHFEEMRSDNMALDGTTACLVLLTHRDPAEHIHVRLDRFVFVP